MSHSREARLKNVDDTLKLCLARTEGVMLVEAYFHPSSDEFNETYSTTWKYFEDHGMMKSQRGHGYDMYEFTGYGWRTALEVAGQLELPELKSRLGKLSQALKNEVKGRHEIGFLSLDDIAERSGLTTDWIFNAIDSRLIQYCFGQIGPEWEHRGRFVSIPIDFGLERL